MSDSNEMLGTCGYEHFEHGVCGEIGFDLAKEHWGKGLMTEALSAIIEYGFMELELSHIEAHTYCRNMRANQVLNKLGFRIQEVKEDSNYCLLSKEDWLNPQLE